jgi:SH3-like domain-containing protein
MSGQNLKSIAILAVCLTVAGGVFYSLFGTNKNTETVSASGEITASTSAIESELGPSGLPLPRFVTLKANRVNVRKGPSSDHAVAWVFQRKGLPVEITAEFENWRKIRDYEGAEGWILQSMLSGKRNGLVATWRGEKTIALRSADNPKAREIASLAPGVLSTINECNGQWCEVETGEFDGFVEQSMLWGVYPGETVN